MEITRLLLISLLLIVYNTCPYCQTNEKISKYNTLTGTEKLNYGIEICDSLSNNPSMFLQFSKKLLRDANALKPNSNIHAKAYKALADAYYYNDDIDSSNKVMIIALNIATSLSQLDSNLIGEIFNDLGLNYLDINENVLAGNYLTKANFFLAKTKDLVKKADAISNLAVYFHEIGQYEKSTELFFDAYQIDIKIGNKERESASLNNIGRVYVDWGKYDTGIESYLNSIKLIDTINDKSRLAIRYNNIGMAYQMKGDHKRAIEWIKKAKSIEEREGNINKLGIRYLNLAISYLEIKDYKNAKLFFEESEKIFSKFNQFKGLAKVYAGLGQLNFQRGHFEKALENYNLSEKYAKIANTLPEQSNVFKLLYQYYEKKGEYKNALKYFTNYIAVKDSMFKLNTARKIEEFEIQYQTAQKEFEISRLESENELKRKEVKFRESERNVAGGGILILTIILAILFRLYKMMRSQRQKLAEQNIELTRLNDIQDQLFSIVSHDFRSIISSYLSGARVMENYLSEGQPEKLIPIANDLNKNSKNLSSMLENLFHWAMLRKKGLEPEVSTINVKEVVEKIVILLEYQINQKNNKIVMDVKDESVNCDKESFNLILRNIISNANKFTKNGTIIIKADNLDKNTLITVSDSGVGMEKDTIQNIFNFGKERPKQGTDGEKGTGIGLLLVKEHLDKNFGTIHVSSIPGIGTTFKITLPNDK